MQAVLTHVRSMMNPTTILQYLGLAVVAKQTYNIFSFLYLYLRPSSLLRYQHGDTGKAWALISGASDGIGKGFAEALCSKGFNVLLHGRNPAKLTNVKNSLSAQFPNTEIRIVTADAFDPSADIASIAQVAESLPGKLTVLINNVGGSPIQPCFGAMIEVDSAHVDKLMNLNARFPTQLTRALLPLLASNNPALVMNITSIAGLQGLPFLATYCASKAWNHNFSESLGAELRALGHDIEVLGIIVGNVISGGNRTDLKGFTCSSLEMGYAALERVGCGKSNVFGWWRHAVQWNLVALLPKALVEKQTIQLMKERKAADEKDM